MKASAVILTTGLLDSAFAKTAHGLIRGSDKYEILGVIDFKEAGKDAGEVIDGKHRDIPVFSNIETAASIYPQIDYAIIGIANPGGIIPEALEAELVKVLDRGISVINGLHTFLSEIPKYRDRAAKSGAELLDIRKAKHRKDLHFWNGSIYEVKCPIIAILGTDCAIGKRTTTRILMDALNKRGVKTEMIHTGQTGMMQHDGYGFIFDSTLNDFVSGELEHAIVQCYRERNPEIILLEGQAALLNPSGPCGPEYLISANARKVILQHAPARTYYKGWDHLKLKIPPVSKSLKLVEAYDAEVIAICLSSSTGAITPPIPLEELEKYKKAYRKEYQLPVIDPVYDDITPLADQVVALRSKDRQPTR